MDAMTAKRVADLEAAVGRLQRIANGTAGTVDADTLDGLDSSAFQLAGAAAGGVLGGTYPNPSFAADMATQAELDVVSAVASGAIPTSLVDAAGDLIVGTADNLAARLAVAASTQDGAALVSDSTQTAKMKWAQPKMPRCRLYRAAAANHATSGALAKIPFDTLDGESYLGSTAMADVANNRIVVRTAGWYRVSAGVAFGAASTLLGVFMFAGTAGAATQRQGQRLVDTAAGTHYANVSCQLNLAVGEVIEAQAVQNGGTPFAYTVGQFATYLEAEYIGP